MVYNQPMSLLDLCQRCNACALKVYLAVAGMLKAGLFDLEPAGESTVAQADDSDAKANQVTANPRDAGVPTAGIIGGQKKSPIGGESPETKGAPTLATATQ